MSMKKISGYTLVELLITILVVAILVAIGFPSYQEMTANNRSLTQVNELITSLNLARSLAIKKHRNVTICASRDQATCNLSNVAVQAVDRNNWEEGWIIQVAGEDVLSHQVLGYSGTNTARGINFTNAGSGLLTFNRLGNTDNPGSIVICDYRGATRARVVLVGATGFAREGLEFKTDPGDGANSIDIVDDDNGDDIACP